MIKSGIINFGPNSTPITTIRNTAIASWDGFVYQGVCGLYVALWTLHQDFEGRKDWMLGLEGYEDFVIQDALGQILSFHQCKSYQNVVDFTKEYKKMEDKRAYWNSQRLCASDAPLYYHCNQPLTYTNGVQAYKYHDGNDTASPAGIYALVKQMVQLIMQAQNIPGSHLVKTAQLIYRIDYHVSWLHQQVMNLPSGQDAFDFVTSHPIKFQILRDILTDTTIPLNKLEQARCVRYYFELWLNERMAMNQHTNDGRVRRFISQLWKADADQVLDLIQRINPDVNINDINAVRELEASSRPNNLYQVLTDTLEELDYNTTMWQQEGELYSPTTLGQDVSPEEQSTYIVRNDNISSLLWDCRWLVGNVKASVDDVREEAKKITAIPIDYSKFTKPGKLGIKTIKNFNDGND